MLDFIEELEEQSGKFKGIKLIRGKEVTGYYTCNSLLIGNTLIDTGFSVDRLKAVIRNYPIKNVIFTHWHEDHISGGNLVKNCNFICHSNDKPVIENVDNMVKLYGYNRSGNKVPPAMINYLNKYKLSNLKINKCMEDHEILALGDESNLNFEVIYSPGHSSGHCCFYEKSIKFAFLSDIAIPQLGPWYGARDSNLIEYEESLNRIMKLDIKSAVLSHYGVVSDHKMLNSILNEQKSIIKRRDSEILNHLSENKPITSDDLLKKNIIYGGDDVVSESQQPLLYSEKIMIEHHLEKLLIRGLLLKKLDGFTLN